MLSNFTVSFVTSNVRVLAKNVGSNWGIYTISFSKDFNGKTIHFAVPARYSFVYVRESPYQIDDWKIIEHV